MITTSGLRKRVDIRDKGYNHAKIFGAPSPLVLPKEGIGRKPLAIYNQLATNFCTAFSTAAASSYQEGIPLSPEFQTAKTSQVEGAPITGGADLRSALKSAVLFGSIPQKDSPYSLENNGTMIADWTKWPDLTQKALVHVKQNYYHVKNGPYDTFDNIRSALWAAKDAHGVVVVGTPWYESWNTKTHIDKAPIGEKTYLAHAWTIIDFTDKYLVAQLSSGEQFGYKGLLYFSREAINYIFRENWTLACILRDKSDNETWLVEALRVALGMMYTITNKLKLL